VFGYGDASTGIMKDAV